MHLALSLLRRLGLALGAYLAAFNYLDPQMATSRAHWISLGLALFFASLPRLHAQRAPAPDPRRGFEVVVPDKTPD